MLNQGNSKELGTSLVWDPSYSRHMHAHKVNVCIYQVIGLEYDQGSLAFIKKLLLLGNIFKAWLLRTLKLCTVYHNTQVCTKEQYNK
jgi:hypothetical protein